MAKSIPQSVAVRSLKGISILASQTWEQLDAAETPEQEAEIVQQLWQLQESEEAAIDAHAELADQIDAELVALKARMEHLVKIHTAEIERLTRWRERLDETILTLNSADLIAQEAIGQNRRIRIKLNPASCEVINFSQVPEDYITTKEIIERKVDKTAVKNAWKQGVPVPGTLVERKRKVVYEIAPTSLDRMKAST